MLSGSMVQHSRKMSRNFRLMKLSSISLRKTALSILETCLRHFRGHRRGLGTRARIPPLGLLDELRRGLAVGFPCLGDPLHGNHRVVPQGVDGEAMIEAAVVIVMRVDAAVHLQGVGAATAGADIFDVARRAAG